jgi:hypothetical protein
LFELISHEGGLVARGHFGEYGLSVQHGELYGLDPVLVLGCLLPEHALPVLAVHELGEFDQFLPLRLLECPGVPHPRHHPVIVPLELHQAREALVEFEALFGDL